MLGSEAHDVCVLVRVCVLIRPPGEVEHWQLVSVVCEFVSV